LYCSLSQFSSGVLVPLSFSIPFLGGIAAASLLSFAMGHFMPLVRLLRWFNSQRRTNGGEADNSVATIAVVVALMTYTDVEVVQ
jgi:hypothetical protein